MKRLLVFLLMLASSAAYGQFQPVTQPLHITGSSGNTGLAVDDSIKTASGFRASLGITGLSFQFFGDTNSGLTWDAADSFHVRTGGVARMRFGATGRVYLPTAGARLGIGILAPLAELHNVGSLITTSRMAVGTTDTTQAMSLAYSNAVRAASLPLQKVFDDNSGNLGPTGWFRNDGADNNGSYTLYSETRNNRLRTHYFDADSAAATATFYDAGAADTLKVLLSWPIALSGAIVRGGMVEVVVTYQVASASASYTATYKVLVLKHGGTDGSVGRYLTVMDSWMMGTTGYRAAVPTNVNAYWGDTTAGSNSKGSNDQDRVWSLVFDTGDFLSTGATLRGISTRYIAH